LAKGQQLPFQKPDLSADDIAVLQYTGGTTGVSKGAVLLHRNLIAKQVHMDMTALSKGNLPRP
jgi:long-chain acyl-CoA synthetase